MGFSVAGMLLSLSILAPNLLMLVFPPRKTPQGLKDAGVVFTALERLGQAGCFILPAVSMGAFADRGIDAWFVSTALCVLAYWGLWARYVACGREFGLLFRKLFFLPIPMAVFPVLAFAFAAAWGQSIWLGAAAAVLALGHWVNSWKTAGQIDE